MLPKQLTQSAFARRNLVVLQAHCIDVIIIISVGPRIGVVNEHSVVVLGNKLSLFLRMFFFRYDRLLLLAIFWREKRTYSGGPN